MTEDLMAYQERAGRGLRSGERQEVGFHELRPKGRGRERPGAAGSSQLKIGFALDSALEESGFELLVPLTTEKTLCDALGAQKRNYSHTSAALLLVFTEGTDAAAKPKPPRRWLQSGQTVFDGRCSCAL
jgi:hypothetical protein